MMRRHAFLLSVVLLLALPMIGQNRDVEQSYHGQLGRGTGLGMLEKWCALPNFSFEEQGGVYGWTTSACNECHIGAQWNPTRPTALCTYCHTSFTTSTASPPTVSHCVTCHKKDTEKRGDLFTPEADVHLAAGMLCQDCHVRMTDPEGKSDHQFARGTTLDTTEPTMKGTLSCLNANCHPSQPHSALGARGIDIDDHLGKVACETCHTGPRPAWALASRQWNVFTATGTPYSVKRDPGWMPTYKWYDGKGAGVAGDYHLPILGVTERRNAPGAKIYPFNAIKVTWFVKTKGSAYDDVIPVPEVKAADRNGDRITTLEEMRTVYRGATLKTADMTFNITHSIPPASQALDCGDCHGGSSWILDWRSLGYKKDPNGGY